MLMVVVLTGCICKLLALEYRVIDHVICIVLKVNFGESLPQVNTGIIIKTKFLIKHMKPHNIFSTIFFVFLNVFVTR